MADQDLAPRKTDAEAFVKEHGARRSWEFAKSLGATALAATGHELHSATGRYSCGPTALEALTGLDYPTVIRPAINRVRGKPSHIGVQGLSPENMVATLRLLGFVVTKVTLPTKPGWTVRTIPASTTAPPMLLDVPHHYVVFHRGVVIDPFMPFGGTLADEHPRYSKSRVKAAWTVESSIERTRSGGA